LAPHITTTPGHLCLSAVTHSYLEGTHHALAAFGSKRDGPKGNLQIVIGLRCAEDGQPGSIAVFPGHTPDPHTLAAQLAQVKTRCGVTALTVVGDRGMSQGQPGEDLATQGCHDISAITKTQIDQRLRTGGLQLDLCDQEVAEGLADEGIHYGRRRHPGRAQAMRDTRHAKLATLQAPVAKQPHYLTDQARANAPGALQQLGAQAEKLRLAAGVALTVAARAITLALKEDARTEAAKLDGCSVLQTDLRRAQAPKELVHARYQELASVEHAFRPCKTAHLAVRPSFLRREARPRAQALAVMLAYQSMRYRASCWSACDVTVAEGLHALTTLGLVEVAPQHAASYHGHPPPRDAIARLLHSAAITLPKAFSLSGTRVSTKTKPQSERLVQ
jgi:hypothetical protein